MCTEYHSVVFKADLGSVLNRLFILFKVDAAPQQGYAVWRAGAQPFPGVRSGSVMLFALVPSSPSVKVDGLALAGSVGFKIE